MIFSSCSLTYFKRFIFWNYSDINDYKKFPYPEISRDTSFFTFKKDITKESNALDLINSVEFQYKDKAIKCSLDELLTSTGTTAFIIIKNDTVLFEKYLNGVFSYMEH
jgi:hypothetical protein